MHNKLFLNSGMFILGQNEIFIQNKTWPRVQLKYLERLQESNCKEIQVGLTVL